MVAMTMAVVVAMTMVMVVVMPVRVSVPMIMPMVAVGADPAHMMMMAHLRRSRRVFVTDDLFAILAELAVH